MYYSLALKDQKQSVLFNKHSATSDVVYDISLNQPLKQHKLLFRNNSIKLNDTKYYDASPWIACVWMCIQKQWASNRCRFVTFFVDILVMLGRVNYVYRWIKSDTDDSGCVGSLGHNNNNKNFTLPYSTNRYMDTLLYTV